MKRKLKTQILLLAAIALFMIAMQTRSAFSEPTVARHSNLAAAQYDDPYSDFRNAKYTNAGLLNERDEIKLGAQLHREVTRKYNLTDVGLDRVERLGQRCARASLRPSLLYKFHVVQNREINGFSLPGGHIYVTTALVRLANDNELGAGLCHEVGHLVARHSLRTLKKSKEDDDIANSPGELNRVAGSIAHDLGVSL